MDSNQTEGLATIPRARSDAAADRARRVFAAALGILLAGYMFLGRGFAHIGIGPVFIGELVLVLAGVALVVVRPPLRLHWLHGLLLIFMGWGFLRTLPYLATYGFDALRDGVLWGYAFFAIAVSLLAKPWALSWVRSRYRWMAVPFVFWVPVAWWVFGNFGDQLPRAPGSDIPLLFFKNQDMAVHLVGVLAFLVAGLLGTTRGRWLLREAVIAIPLAFGVYVSGAISRGALAAAAAGTVALAVLRPRTRHWIPVLIGVGAVVLAVALGFRVGPADGREISPGQWADNIASVLGESSDEGLEGTISFRLAWWSEIIDYTVDGPYFWLGKGYGINLADDDGFQIMRDGSLRAPHNSHLSVLARSGVPGLALWLAFQIGFGVTLLVTAIRAGRRRLGHLAAVSAWVLVYWFAMMVNTSFDPYLEGPQGGIWFWSLVGLGLACVGMIGRAAETHGP